MFVSEDGTVTGSINRAQLDEVEPKTDEARAQLEALKAEAKLGEEIADAQTARSLTDTAGQGPAGATDAEIARLEAAVAELKARRDARRSGDEPAARTTQAQAPAADAEVTQLQQQATAAGVNVDKRWGADRLRQEIAAAGSGKRQA